MAVDFEAATIALFNRFANLSAIKYATRKIEPWSEIPPSMQPSLMLIPGTIDVFEVPSSIRGISPPLWLMKYDVVLYIAEQELDEIPSVRINDLVSAVCNALLYVPGEPVLSGQFLAVPPGTYGTTLGGLCAYARVSGTIERVEGVQGHIAQAIIPVEMVLSS